MPNKAVSPGQCLQGEQLPLGKLLVWSPPRLWVILILQVRAACTAGPERLRCRLCRRDPVSVGSPILQACSCPHCLMCVSTSLTCSDTSSLFYTVSHIAENKAKLSNQSQKALFLPNRVGLITFQHSSFITCVLNTYDPFNTCWSLPCARHCVKHCGYGCAQKSHSPCTPAPELPG